MHLRILTRKNLHCVSMSAENDHFIHWDKAKILQKQPHWHKRQIAKGYLINRKSLELNVLNRNDGLIVPSEYKSL